MQAAPWTDPVHSMNLHLLRRQVKAEASEGDEEPLAQLAGSRGKPGRAAAKAAAAAAGL